MGELDEVFVQDPEHRPTSNSGEFSDEIPTIDISSLEDPDQKSRTIAAIAEASKRWGFFQVINHGVPSETRRRVEKAAKEFFDLTPEEKRKVKREEGNPMGYYDEEHTKNVRDWKEVFDFYLQDRTVIPVSPAPEDTGTVTVTNQWPKYPHDFREVCQEYAKEVEKLALKLLELISLSLELGEGRLSGYFKEQTSFLRLNYYRPCPKPELVLGVGRHKDLGALTILAQDNVGGLQVRRRSDGLWISVSPIPNVFIVNIGDCMQVWTNDKYWSAEHRAVVNSSKERLSIPFFFSPSSEANVEPLEELVSEQNPPIYKRIQMGQVLCFKNQRQFQET